MKKFPLLLSALALSACSYLPAVQGDKGSLSFVDSGALLANATDSAMLSPVIRAEGPGLVLAAPCVLRRADVPGVYGCILDDIQPGKGAQLIPSAGRINHVQASYYRASSGARFIYLENSR